MLFDYSAGSIIEGFNKVKGDRLVVENTWDDVMYYTMPRKRDIQSIIEKGDKVPTDVFDDTAIQSNIILAAGLSGYMTNASQRWFELRPRDFRLLESPGVKTFFSETAEIIYSVLATTNFYQQVNELYLDLGAIGTAAMYISEDEIEDVRFYTRHPKEIFILENDREVVDMVYRAFKMTAWAAYNFFGKNNCGQSILKAIEAKEYNKEFDYIHFTCPRDVRDTRKMDNLNKPFASFWVSVKDKKVCKESGFNEFPYTTPRFYKNSDQTYGFAPGIASYSNIKMLNKMMEYYIKGAETSIWPPFLAEHDSLMNTFSLKAGAINYQRASMAQSQQIQPIDIKMKYQIAIDFITRVEQRIQSAFFADLFLLITHASNMTATEVIERTQEKMLLLGPVMGRLQSELLNTVIVRVFNILLRRGKLPSLPQALINNPNYDVVYISPLAKAQRAVQAKDMTTYLTIIGQMAQFTPDILDNVNTDNVAKKLSRIYGVDADILNEEDDVNAIREARARQQTAINQMAMMQQGADIAQTAGKAESNFAKARQTSKQ